MTIPKTASQPVIWLLLDDRAGNRSQCLGVGDALNLPYQVKELSYSWRGALPNALTGASFLGLTKQSRQTLSSPWPDLVIAAGRRTAPVAREIKRLSSGETILVQIMWPGGQGSDEFDLIAVPNHDNISNRHNVLNILGSPHGISPEALAKLKTMWTPRLADCSTPRISLIVGGSTKNRSFTPAMAKQLGSMASEMANRAGGCLLVSTSRRTGDATKHLIDAISAPAKIYHWGDSGDNPYPAFLACSDAIIVTGESMSMCSEACSGEGPVYIYAPEQLITAKHQRLHDALYKAGYARPFKGQLEEWQHPSLNSANDIAEAVDKLLRDKNRNA